MRILLAIPFALALSAAFAPAQDLVAVTINGDVYHLDGVTAVRSYVGNCGFNDTNCLAKAADGTIYSFTASTSSLVPSKLVEIDPNTGAGVEVGSYAALNVAGAAFDYQDRLFLLVYANGGEELWRLDSFGGSPVFVATLPVTAQPMQALAYQGGWLYAWSDTDQFCTNVYGIGLVRIHPATGALSDVGPTGDPTCGDIQSLCAAPSGDLWAAGLTTWTMDPNDGIPTGFGVPWNLSFRGMEFVGASGPFLAFSGTVPGQATLTVSNATPGGLVAFVYGNPGTYVRLLPPCAGLELDIAVPNLGAVKPVNAAGVAVLNFMAPASASGKTVQAVDVSSCVPSNAIVLP